MALYVPLKAGRRWAGSAIHSKVGKVHHKICAGGCCWGDEMGCRGIGPAVQISTLATSKTLYHPLPACLEPQLGMCMPDRSNTRSRAHQPGWPAHTVLSGVMRAWSRSYLLLVKPGRSVHSTLLQASSLERSSCSCSCNFYGTAGITKNNFQVLKRGITGRALVRLA